MTEVNVEGGGRLVVKTLGSGPPLLLVRPLGGSILSWGEFAEELAGRFEVIMFDSRGTGTSTPAPWGMTTRSMARDARSVLDALGIERAHVYGISLGGMVASWLAIDAPARVGQLSLASTLPRGTMIAGGSWRRELALARCLAKEPSEAEACMATQILSRRFRATHPEAVDEIRRAARVTPATRSALTKLLFAAWTHDARRRLHAIQSPVLVLIGGHDPLLSIDSQKNLLVALGHATYDVMADAGHDISAEAPHATAARVTAAISAYEADDARPAIKPRA